MPHLLLSGTPPLNELWERPVLGVDRTPDWIVKTLQAFLSADRASMLVECAVVEGYLHQSFLAQLIPKEGGLLIRLYPGTAPEKTDGVRYCLASIAMAIRARYPRSTVARHNLGIPLPAALTG